MVTNVPTSIVLGLDGADTLGKRNLNTRLPK